MKLNLNKTHKTIFSNFFQTKMLKIFLLGLISGFPWVLIGSSLSLWLKEDGLSRSSIGWAGLIFSVYAFNYLWAPLVDKIKIPILSQKIGHRKSWIFCMQTLIIICLILWSLINPINNLYLVILIGLLIAICSSTQDITIDALRIEQFKQTEKNLISAAASIAVVGWWTGFKLGGFVSLNIADLLQKNGFYNYWQLTFLILAIIIAIFNLSLLLIMETNKKNIAKKKVLLISKFSNSYNIYIVKTLSWFSATFVMPILAFFKKNGVIISISILIFIFSFKIGEAFLGRMSVIFYKELGFSKTDIGLFSKGFGWITTIIFTLLGGVFTIRAGIFKAIFIAGIFMALTNILFSFLAWSGKNYELFAIAVILDDIAAAFATIAFVAFISVMVDRNYTATQYALLASIGTAGRTILASSSGSLVDWLEGDWGIFFIITTLMVIPSLIILFFLSKHLSKTFK